MMGIQRHMPDCWVFCAFWLAMLLTLNVQAAQIPNKPPRCSEMCAHLMTQATECLKTCPNITFCIAARNDDTTAQERYDPQTSYEPRSKPCKIQCKGGNIYLEKQCMDDCPKTWCAKFSGLSPERTGTTTSVNATVIPSSYFVLNQSVPPEGSVHEARGRVGGIIGSGILIAIMVPITALVIYRRKAKGKASKSQQVESSGRAKIEPTPSHGLLDPNVTSEQQ